MISVDLPGSVSVVETEPGLPRLRIATPAVVGQVYLQGAHITEWTPAGQRPVIWMSQASALERGRPIRGGVPICFPWFGAGRDSQMSPLHGFARLADWSFVSAVDLDDVVTLTFRLTHADVTDLPGAAAWGQEFELTYVVTFGAELTIVLTVRNTGPTDFSFEEALHTYFAVEDIRQVSVDGLAGTRYLDKAAGTGADFAVQEGPVRFSEETERVFYSTSATTIADPKADRSIRIAKYGSSNTVVWNPWQAKAGSMSDFDDDGWPDMVCVETANAVDFAITLRPGAAQAMAARYIVQPGPYEPQ
jgi:glucose-6-phosphate 1-epimerase